MDGSGWSTGVRLDALFDNDTPFATTSTW